MAKSGVFETDKSRATFANATELKKELHKLVKKIIDEEDPTFEIYDRANQTLRALKDLKANRSSSLKLHHSPNIPQQFLCPLSKQLMGDPVILATGQTYDRPFIQKWLKAGNKTCPRTQQVLAHTILTPNHLIRDMILQWCRDHGIKSQDSIQYSDEDGLTEADADPKHFFSLLEKMSSTASHQKESARELRLLTKRMPSIRALFGESVNAIPQLLTPLSQSNIDQSLQEDLITTLLNLSIHDNNKKLVAETPMVIPLVLNALRLGTIVTRSNAAATLFTLSALDTNKEIIGKLGALKPLIDLLEEGHPLAMKDVASAIFNLCILHENKARAVRDGVVRVILKKITSRMNVDELLAILAMLSSNQRAIEEMGELGAVPCLFSIIRESSCARNKENAIAILHVICFNDRTKWREMREEENIYGTISCLAQNGTSRAKRKASGILERLNRGINLTHTA